LLAIAAPLQDSAVRSFVIHL